MLGAYAVHWNRTVVASGLHVSVNKVEAQLRSAYRKLGARTRDEALVRAIELDLLD